MTRWIIAIGVGILMLCEMFFAVPAALAQTPGGPFEQLSPGNQKAARALFEAQNPPPGTKPLTLDQIAARKQSGEGWGRVFSGMKSQGLVDSKNFGQTVSSFNHRHNISSHGAMTTAANRPVQSHGVATNSHAAAKAGTSNQGKSVSAAGTSSHGSRVAATSGGQAHGRGK